MIDVLKDLDHDVLLTSAAAIIAALLGGLLSLISAIFVFRMSAKKELAFHERKLNVARDTNARIGLSKLISTVNKLHSLNLHINAQFQRANEDGLVVEPGLAITPSISGETTIERLSAQELEFLFHSKGTLVSDIHLFESRASTTLAAFQEYCRKREQLDEFTLEHGRLSQDLDGNIVSTEFGEAHGRRAEIMVAGLNIIIAEVVEKVEQDLAEGLDLLNKYRDAAVAQFGEKFPQVAGKDEK